MGLIQSIGDFFRPQASTPGPLDDFWYSGTPYTTHVGVRVNPTTAMKVTALYACIRLLSETGGSVPCQLFRRLEDDSKELATDHSLYNVLLNQPNDYQTTFDFWEQVIRCCGLRGFFYAEIVLGPLGQVAQLRPLHPDRVIHELQPSGKMLYRYLDPTGRERIFNTKDLFRVMYYTEEDGMTPISPISANADTVGITEAAERYAASYFGNSAIPGGSLEADGKLSPEARKEIARSWNATHKGPDNAGKIAVLDQGLKFKQITINNQDSQLLETRQWQLTDICRVYRVPPHLVQDLTRSTFTNIEHQSLDFITHTMRPWFRRIETAISRDLMMAIERPDYFARFNLNDLLAADAAARAAFYSSGIQNGWMTRNEARKFENLNPLDELDEPLMPSNLRGVNDPAPESSQAFGPGQQSTSNGGNED
jgi:HK97 family phage portal protein